MWDWIAQNKEWFFSGAGLTILGIIWSVLIKPSGSKREAALVPAPANTVTQAPIITVSPTFNVPRGSLSPEPLKKEPPDTPSAPVARANLKVEAAKVGKVWLQGDIWTLVPGEQSSETRFRGLFVDIANVPTASGNIKTTKLEAALTIQSRSYSPLPWLGEYTNAIWLEPAARKTILLAAGHDQ